MASISPEKIKKLQTREEMLTKRYQVSIEDARSFSRKISEEVMDIINTKRQINCVGIYTAISKEIDMNFLAEMILSKGIKVALPRIVTKNQPMIFNQWDFSPLREMDAEGIPCSVGPEINPDIVIIPLLAFNKKGYRLGYGGGYYDRSFATCLKGAFSIGVAYSFQEVDDLAVEEHDVPLDVIVTEKETTCL